MSLLAFSSSGVCLVDVPQMFHIIWTTQGMECEAFCKSSVTTTRYGLQSSAAETCLSSQATEWEQVFKLSRRQGGKAHKKPYQKSVRLTELYLNRSFVTEKELKFLAYFSNIHFRIYIDRTNETAEQSSKWVPSTALILNDYLRKRKKRKGKIRKPF